ncbi:MAG: hypothetical protein WA364_18325, partial [Candidatus Nitrosopolaris sp.]
EKNAAFVFLIESIKLPAYTQKIGPKIFMKQETANFILKGGRRSLITWVDREMRVSTVIPRTNTNAVDFLKFLLTYKIENIGIPKGLIGDIRELFEIYSGDDQRLSGLAKEAAEDLITSDSLIF